MAVCEVVGVEECHASGDIPGKGEPEIPVQRDVVIHQHVIQAALGAVLTDDGHVDRSISDCDSKNLAEVGVLQASARSESTRQSPQNLLPLPS